MNSPHPYSLWRASAFLDWYREQIGRDVFTEKHRSRSIVAARRVAWMILRDIYGLSYFEIARLVGMDASTVLLGLKAARRLPEIAAQAQEIYAAYPGRVVNASE